MTMWDKLVLSFLMGSLCTILLVSAAFAWTSYECARLNLTDSCTLVYLPGDYDEPTLDYQTEEKDS